MNKEEKIAFINNYIKNKVSTYQKDSSDFYLKFDFNKHNQVIKLKVKEYKEKNPEDLGYINPELKIFFNKKIAELLKEKIKIAFKGDKENDIANK